MTVAVSHIANKRQRCKVREKRLISRATSGNMRKEMTAWMENTVTTSISCRREASMTAVNITAVSESTPALHMWHVFATKHSISQIVRVEIQKVDSSSSNG